MGLKSSGDDSTCGVMALKGQLSANIKLAAKQLVSEISSIGVENLGDDRINCLISKFRFCEELRVHISTKLFPHNFMRLCMGFTKCDILQIGRL